MTAYGEMARMHAQAHYDVFIHLPVEFPLVPDGHRPVNEKFRLLCDQLLYQVYSTKKLPVMEVRGNIAERLNFIVRRLALPQKMDICKAIQNAQRQVIERYNNIPLECMDK